MKKILFYITLAMAICLPDSFCAQGAALELGFHVAQRGYVFDVNRANTANLNFEACLEDFSDDDDSDESENKETSSGNTSVSNTSFATHTYSENNFNSLFIANLFLASKVPLFLFNCVFRI